MPRFGVKQKIMKYTYTLPWLTPRGWVTFICIAFVMGIMIGVFSSVR